MKFQIGDPVRVADPESPYVGMTGRVDYIEGGDVYVTLWSWGIDRSFTARQLTARDETPLTAAQMRERMSA
jgi:hypothetical protein